MFNLNDRNQKTKWLNRYKEEMNSNKEKIERDRMHKLTEEKEFLLKIKKEEDEDKMKQIENKKMIIQDELNEYYKHLINREKDELKSNEDKRNTDNVSLNLGTEERLERMKDNFIRLDQKVDQNMNNYKNYELLNKIQDNSEALNYYNNPNIYDLDPQFNRKVTDIHEFGKHELSYRPKINENEGNSFLDQIYKKNYQKYKELHKNIFNYNKNIVEDKMHLRESDKVYPLCDNKDNFYFNHELNHKKTSYSPLHNFPNSEFIPNPYNKKPRYDLGSTLLEHNTILNPVHNYKHNRYLFNSSDQDHYFDKKMNDEYFSPVKNNPHYLKSSLQNVGIQIMR